jgi:hypothetical protein
MRRIQAVRRSAQIHQAAFLIHTGVDVMHNQKQFAAISNWKRLKRTLTAVLPVLAAISLGSGAALAQSLNWEGQTGVFVTPLAYSISTGNVPLSIPVVSYHFLDAGPVLGNFHQISISMGAFNRLEFGYTGNLHQDGSIAGLSSLWSTGFNAFHAKANLWRERRGGLPAISVGFVARTQVRNVGGVIQGHDTNNQDFYVVATKTITRFRKIPLVFNAGFKATNASLLGLAGNAPGYYGRGFGAAGFAFKGPGKSTILLGSEVLQEPRRIQGLPGAVVPTTITYAVRIVPSGALPIHGWGVESPKLTIDLGLAQVAGNIMPGVDLQARHQFAFGISYGF